MDCSGCSDCLFSWGLRNKRHCILNQQYTPEEYKRKAEELELGSRAAFSDAQKEFNGVRLRCIRKAVHSTQSEDCSGDYLQNCKACTACFNALDSQDCRHMFDGVSCKDCGDCNEMGYSELCYDVVEAFPEAYGVLWSFLTANTSDMQYCDHCYNSKHLFGCVGIRKGEYCILNKQYSKDEYEELAPKIIEKMTVDGEWGEFLPVAMSPFAYNETVAQEAFPLTKGEAEKRGWQWRDAEEKQSQYLGPDYVIPDIITDAPDAIVEKILRCSITGKPYKIIPQELKFYRDMGLPIPRICPEERHKERMTLRNPRKLWHRECMKCSKGIETTYSPDRPEIVYCESCYLASVY